MAYGESEHIYGCHEKCPLDVMLSGWVLYIAEVGDSADPHLGIDLSDEPRGRMIRIQWRFGDDGGCYPPPHLQDGFIQRVESLVHNTPDCHIFIGGNEPNLEAEGEFTPEYTAQSYGAIRDAVHAQPGHEADQVLLPPIGPWYVSRGVDWIEYFTRLIDLCPAIDGFALHTYSRGPDPASVTAQDKMDAPYEMYYNGFQTYRDWMATIPAQYQDRPVYITEANQNDAWLNMPNTWVQAAYAEIDKWNQTPAHQPIRALILYRWPRYDKYHIDGKANVIADFKLAQMHNYKWTDEPNPPNPPGDGPMKNPSFELPYYHEPQTDTVKVAHDWTAFYSQGDPPQEQSQGPCQVPEYKPLLKALDPRRVVDGDTAQCWFIRYKVMDAGVYQTVDATAGKRYTFNVSLQAWCSNSDDPNVSDGEMYCSLGIDARGGTNPWELGILWTPWQWVNADHQRFTSLEVQAQESEITLFIRCWNKWRLSHNDIYADDAHLIEVGGTTPPPGGGLTEERVREIAREEIEAYHGFSD